MNIILFVGSNPSVASAVDVAFHNDTRSSRTLTNWIRDVSGMKVYVNVSREKTDSNRPLSVAEIKERLPELAANIKAIGPHRIVALGKTAARALTLLRQTFLEMPHPSGLNRQLNNAAYVQQKVNELVRYCSTQD